MKKSMIESMILTLAAVLILTGCGGQQAISSKAAAGSALSGSSVSQLLENAAANADNANKADNTDNENNTGNADNTGNANNADGVDSVDYFSSDYFVDDSESFIFMDTPEQTDISEFAHDGIDIDLTRMSSTMIYGQVAGMMYLPEDYIGKTIRIRGVSSSEYYDVTDTTYYTVFVADAAACCAQGIEYVLTDGAYPDEEEEITVTGVFELYDELGITYCRLADAQISL